MPQLDPSPWLTAFVLSWITLLIIAVPKTLAHTFPNEPTPLSTQALETKPWLWLWS